MFLQKQYYPKIATILCYDYCNKAYKNKNKEYVIIDEMEGYKMNFKHSFNNNGSNKKLESNQQQTSFNQRNNFNVSQQDYQQNGPNQNYNPITSGHVQQNISQQQYSSTKNIGSQQYQQQNDNSQNYNNHLSTNTNQGIQSAPQYQQQNVNQQYSPNISNWEQQNNQQINTMQENLQQLWKQVIQPQTIAERITNMQNRTSIKLSDFLNTPVDRNVKVGLDQNMNTRTLEPFDLFDDKQQKGTNRKKHQTNIEKIQCQCKNCVKKIRPWLIVFITILIVLAILGGCVGVIYGFRPQLRDWLLKDEVATENVNEVV